MICETKQTILCDDPPNDDTEEEEEEVEAPVQHLVPAFQATLISDISVTPSLPPPPAKTFRPRRAPLCPYFLFRSTCKTEVLTLSRVLECLDMLELVRFRPVCRAWRDAIDCLPYFFEPTPYPSQRLWQQKGFEFVSVDPAFKFGLCPLTSTDAEAHGGAPHLLFHSMPIIKLQVHGQWGLLSGLFLTFFGKKAVRRKARNELSAQCVVKRRGQLLPVEVTGRAVESSQALAAAGGAVQPRGGVPTDSDWDRHEVVPSDAHIILFPSEEELREMVGDPEADFFEQECSSGVENVLQQPLKVPDVALRLRKRIETVERLNGLESVVEYLPWELPPAVPSAVPSVSSDTRALPLAAIPVETVSIHVSSFAGPASPTSSAEAVLSHNRQHALTAISKVLKQYLETDGFSVVARGSPEEAPSFEQSLVTLVNQVQSFSSQGLEMGLECLELGKDAGAALLQTGSVHTSNAFSTTAAAGSWVLQTSLAFAVSSLQGWWTAEETKDSSSQGDDDVRIPLASLEEAPPKLSASPADEIF